LLTLRTRPIKHFILKLTALCLFAVSFAGCAELPDYAKPRTIPREEGSVPRTTAFTYRLLTRDDFRAVSLPQNISEHGQHINAQSAIVIRLTPDSRFSIGPWTLWGGVQYLGRIDQIAFEAVFIPETSWWNPRMNPAKTAYVLQHEQIHFAIIELAARQLTRESQEWAPLFLMIKPTPEEVSAEISKLIKEKINAAMEANKERHLEFDSHTSLSFSPLWQSWWAETVQNELDQTASNTTPPSAAPKPGPTR
jgi:hypothetical protein